MNPCFPVLLCESPDLFVEFPVLLLCVGVLCLIPSFDEVESGCGDPWAFGGRRWGAEVVGGGCRESRREVVAEVCVLVAVCGVGGDGVPKSRDLASTAFDGCVGRFSVEFGGSLGFLRASSLDPKFGDHQSVIGIQSS